MQCNGLTRLLLIIGVIVCVLPLQGQADSDKKQESLKPVTQERLLRGTEDTSAWLMYGGNYQSWRFSPLKDINRQNVKKLTPAWIFQPGVPEQLEASPIVADGILYLSTSYSHLFALNAVTGEPIWKYDHPLPNDLRICCGPTNRGVAIAADKVFLTTLDAHLVALERKTGKVAWDTKVDDYTNGYSLTIAPLVVKNKVIIGIAGGEYGVRGYIDAYDAETGERKWRRYTTPSAGEKGVETWAGDSWKNSGGSAWALALDDKSGELLWKYQTGSGVRGQPVTYKINGRQYVAIPSGGGGIVPNAVGEPSLVSKGTALIVFALPQ